MTVKPLTVQVEDRVADALRLMRLHRIRHLPVLDGHTLAGIISDRDLRWVLGQEFGGATRAGAAALADRVGDVMTGAPVTVAPEADVLHAVDQLLDRRIGGLPVVNAAGVLVGIVTYVDVLRACRDLLQMAR
jgi:acetoin utilization protein AcuB